jgi:hypothetical protein
MLIDKLLERPLLISLNQCINIDKAVGQLLSEQGTNRAFPGTGHPDQNQIHFSCRHDKIVHQWRKKDNQTQYTYKAVIVNKP